MLKSLEFENFKSWGGRHRLEFGRITGLFGPNSSGKSSVFHLLLLLKQTVESPDSTVVLNFGGNPTDYVDFGSFIDIITDHDASKTLAYSLDWTLDGDKYSCHDHSVRRIYISSTIDLVPGNRGGEVVVSRLDYKADVGYPDGNLKTDTKASYRDISSGPFAIESSRDIHGAYTASVYFQGKTVFKSKDILNPIGPYRFNPNSIHEMMGDIFSRNYDGEGRSKNVAGDSYIADVLDEVTEQAEHHTFQLLNRMVYLGPLRYYPRRNYTWTGVAPTTVGHRGEQAIQVLLAEKEATVEAVSKWMQRLGVSGEFSLRQAGEGSRIWEPLLELQNGSSNVNLVDVGFGVSQVLPVIVALLSARRGSLVILEHPDIHLHPSAQSALADLLIDISNTGDIQILVESHSEHLLGSDSAEDRGVFQRRWRPGARRRAPLFLRAGGRQIRTETVRDATVRCDHQLAA